MNKINRTMKKYLMFSFMLLSVLAVEACANEPEKTVLPEPEQTEPPGGGTEGEGQENGSGHPETKPENKARYLVLFSSRSGNTEAVAREIGRVLEGDLTEVEPAVPYDDDYQTMLERSRREQAGIEEGNYPAVTASVESFDDYDLIFVGYPIWYGHMAAPMQAFLHGHAGKLAGKRIALFATSGSSGISASAADAQALCPEAVFTPTLLLTSGTLGQMSRRVTEWMARLGVNGEK